METWFIIIISLCIAGLIRSVFNAIYPPKNLPPQPFTLPFIGSVVLLRKSFSELKPIIRDLHAKHGPVVSLQFGRRTMVFVSGRSLAHQALIQNSAVFADRPPALTTAKITSCDQHNISAGFYGPTWRALRRNLTAEILHPARVKSYTRARRWVLGILLDRLRSEPGTEVQVVDHFQYTMFCLLVLMCFGDRLEEKQIKQIEEVHREMLLSTRRFTVLNFWPAVGKVLFRRQWEEFHQIRRQQSDVLIPLIRARAESRGKAKEETESNQDHDSVVCYVDTLLNFKLPITNRSLTEPEVEGLCFEFLAGGIDTTATALQWIMANLVKNPSIQSRIFDELKANLGARLGSDVIEEEDLHKLPYLKAVVLEGLRRHPPGHFVLPHAVTEDTELGGFLVPKNGTSVNFLVADMGWDPTVWEDPMAFKPDRFLNSDGNEGGFDLTGSREIKMMPFGVGRRMCPGYNLALLHLEYFLANLVWAFEWRASEGDEVDLAEKQEFTVVMKNPLKAIIRPRMET